jgi:hypothetical protein
MPKYFGKVGFAESVETAPGIWEDRIIERSFYGDVVRDLRRLQNHTKLNDDITITNSFSIVADKYAYANFHKIRYLEYMGTKWKVESVDASTPPRLTLDVGAVYNE